MGRNRLRVKSIYDKKQAENKVQMKSASLLKFYGAKSFNLIASKIFLSAFVWAVSFWF